MPQLARPSRQVAVTALLLLGILLSHPSLAQDTSVDRQAAEQQLIALQEQIAELQQDLEAARTEYQGEQQALRQLDLEIDETAGQSRDLTEQEAAHREELDALESEKDSILETLDERKDQLAEILRSAYQLDRHSRLKLVLNQDNPGELNRMLAYYEYFNAHKVDDIAELRESLQSLEAVQTQINTTLTDLEVTRSELDETIRMLDGQRENRLTLIAELDSRIGNDEARLEELQQNRRDLVLLLERLENALADIPNDLGERRGVAQQKGKLPMPTPGRVKHAYGQNRAGSMHWQGWLIGAEAGSEVYSVAYGRVAFADWLRGYGLMLIIDHGNGFLSLYGNNESLVAEVGDWVEPGALIGVVGSNPGMTQGLYFELRKDGKAVDPAAWIKR